MPQDTSSIPAASMGEVARAWLRAFQDCVRTVDYERARPMFAEDVVSFGTHARIVAGRDRLENEQWREVWPRIRDFTFRLDAVHCFGDERNIAVVVPWDSLGVPADAPPFPRPGRATLVLDRRDGRWVAAHSHFSLAPSAR